MTKAVKIIKDNIIGAAVFAAIGLLCAYAAVNPAKILEKTRYNDFLAMAENGEVAEATLTDGATIRFSDKGGAAYETDNPRSDGLKERLLTLGINVKEGTYVSTAQGLGMLLFIGALGAAFAFQSKLAGKAGAKSSFALEAAPIDGDKATATFDDIAGCEEAKREVAEVVDFIKTPEKYAAFGARLPRGIILYGPPGTGKTLMARAVAGEAGVAFFNASGSDFVQMYVGVGAARVRELFKKARETGKAVVFIDEIDALGKKRASGAGANDERDQTLNQLLAEMSGFNDDQGIVVMAATNRLDTLDEALLRPGRFDKHIEIGLPDRSAREKILERHARNKPLSDGVNIGRLAEQTYSFSGAALENLLNEAAIKAAVSEGENITNADIEYAYTRVVAGSPKLSGSTDIEKRVCAHHEAGHALASNIFLPENTIAKITITPNTSGAGGFCISIPPEKAFMTKREARGRLAVLLAGRAAEEIILGAEEITTGACNDLEKAAGLARDCIEKFGFGGSLAPVKADAEEAAQALIDEVYGETLAALRARLNALTAAARELIRVETLTGGEFAAICRAADNRDDSI